jgi:mannose-6-phosphate isomerase-like protein (cupin superfamily)
MSGLGHVTATVVVMLSIYSTFAGAQGPAPEPALPGYFQYSPAQLVAYEQALRPRMNQLKQSAEGLHEAGTYQAWVAHREADGLAEIHEQWTDFMYVISGEATLLLGGEVVGAYTDSPGEIRGTGVRGGVTRVVRQGDVVNVPAGMQHRFLVGNGQQITFFTMKIARAQ